MRASHNALRGIVALVLIALALGGCSKHRALETPSQGGPERVALERAQAEVDFVIYAPAYLPSGTAVGKALVIPEQMVGKHLLPNEVALELGAGLALWEMPAGAVPLSGPRSMPVALNGKAAWLSRAPGLGRRTLEWEMGGTRIGLSGEVDASLLLRIAGSFRPAHPEVTPRPISAQRERIAPGLAHPLPPLPPGGIGAYLADSPLGVVVAVYPQMPAAKAGISPGDRVIEVSGQPVVGASSGEMVRLVRGQPGSRVTLTVQPRGERGSRKVTLTRAPVPVLHRRKMSAAQARAAVGYPLLVASYLPQGFQLAEVMLHVWEPNPARLEPEVQHSYDGPEQALLEITQRAGQEAWQPWRPPRASRPVAVGSARAMVGRTPAGAWKVQWTDGATALRVSGMGVARAEVLRVARSMGRAEGDE